MCLPCVLICVSLVFHCGSRWLHFFVFVFHCSFDAAEADQCQVQFCAEKKSPWRVACYVCENILPALDVVEQYVKYEMGDHVPQAGGMVP